MGAGMGGVDEDVEVAGAGVAESLVERYTAQHVGRDTPSRDDAPNTVHLSGIGLGGPIVREEGYGYSWVPILKITPAVCRGLGGDEQGSIYNRLLLNHLTLLLGRWCGRQRLFMEYEAGLLCNLFLELNHCHWLFDLTLSACASCTEVDILTRWTSPVEVHYLGLVGVVYLSLER